MKTGCSIRILHAGVNDGKYGVTRGRPIMRLRRGFTDSPEYFAANGVMPGSLDALGYDADWTPSNVLESVDIQAGGVIVLRFASRPRGEVVLIPNSAADLIRGWQCESQDLLSIEQIADCRFTGSIY